MKIGVLGDVHGNIYAFEAEIQALKDAGAELILCTGDLVGIGPFHEEVVRAAMGLSNFICVKGNHEIKLFSDPSALPERELAHHRWKLSRLSGGSLAYLTALPMEYTLTAEGFRLKILHYPFDGQVFRKIEHDCDGLQFCETFSGVTGDIVLFGHDHRRVVRSEQGRIFLNFGSCGCPHRYEGVARGGILELKNGVAEYSDCTARYDLSLVIKEIDKLKYADFSYIKKVFYGVEC